MKNIYNVVLGASGFAKELEWLIEDLYQSDNNIDYRVDFFVVEDSSSKAGGLISNKPIITESELIKKIHSKNIIRLFIGVGNPKLKSKLVSKFSFENIEYPSVVHPSVQMDFRANKVKIGIGTIICAGTVLTTDIKLGDFVHINLNCTIGHDVVIKKYSTLSPNVNIAGNVNIRKFNFIGLGSNIIEKINIIDDIIIGGGAVVVKDINEPGVYVGVPANKIK